MKNAEWMIKNGHKFSDLSVRFKGSPDFSVNSTVERVCVVRLKKEIIDTFKSTKPNCQETYKEWLDMEQKEQILDEAEKNYLSAVIRPFRNEVRYISKKWGATKETSFARIEAKCCRAKDGMTSWLCFPVFNAGTMYKGMEPNKEYTLEELGL